MYDVSSNFSHCHLSGSLPSWRMCLQSWDLPSEKWWYTFWRIESNVHYVVQTYPTSQNNMPTCPSQFTPSFTAKARKLTSEASWFAGWLWTGEWLEPRPGPQLSLNFHDLVFISELDLDQAWAGLHPTVQAWFQPVRGRVGELTISLMLKTYM